MRKIKKVLGLVLAVTVCVLGLASCGESNSTGNSTVEVDIAVYTSRGLEIEKANGELYVHTINFEEPENAGMQYLLFASEGVYYSSDYSKEEDKYTFYESGKWKIIDDMIICVGEHYYLRDGKYLISSTSGIRSEYMRVDGLKYANK